MHQSYVLGEAVHFSRVWEGSPWMSTHALISTHGGFLMACGNVVTIGNSKVQHSSR